MKIGCHVSIAGGVYNAPANAAALGCETFQIFSRSPRGGSAAPITGEVLHNLQTEMVKYGFSDFVIHTPYYINFGSKNSRIRNGSAQIVREELERASKLGAGFVMTHLGSYKDNGKEVGFEYLVEGLEKVMKGYKGSAMLLLETSAGAGEVMGGTFDELGKILNHPKLKKYRIGICLDTAHVFASGYDVRNKTVLDETLKEFDQKIGLKKLMVIHGNDSKVGLGEKKDRHDHIGKGKIGRAGFEALVNHPKLRNVNLYLETEHDEVKKDIALLKEMRKHKV